jgi:tRNA pseudouridine synthase 10
VIYQLSAGPVGTDEADPDTDLSDLGTTFGVLAGETRLAVLRALVRADGPLRFSDLRERVDVRDSGRFDHHRRQLLGRFVGNTRERVAAAYDPDGDAFDDCGSTGRGRPSRAPRRKERSHRRPRPTGGMDDTDVDVLATARALLDTGPLCDACLGRPFAARSFGLRNEERGKGLRVTLALADDADYDALDPADCWVCEGVCGRFDELAERCVEALDGTEFRTYQLGTRVPPLVEENEILLREDAGLAPDAGEQLNSEVNREVGRRLGRLTGTDVEFERPDVQLTLDLDADTVHVQRNSVAVYGRYRKLERGISQTDWEKYDHSVESFVSPAITTAHRGTEGVFHGAGREDVDALMLGTGRPFVLEVKQPRRREVDLAELEAQVNEDGDGKVEAEGLRYATHNMVERVKMLDANKIYRMDVGFDEPVTAEGLAGAVETLRGATVEQRTPNRVSHRRADLVRERAVYDITGELDDEYHAELTVDGEGGLYVKELVSGDEGRTEPSLAGLLGVPAVVTHLDVLSVEGEGEPFAEPEFLREVEPEAEAAPDSEPVAEPGTDAEE